MPCSMVVLCTVSPTSHSAGQLLQQRTKTSFAVTPGNLEFGKEGLQGMALFSGNCNPNAYQNSNLATSYLLNHLPVGKLQKLCVSVGGNLSLSMKRKEASISIAVTAGDLAMLLMMTAGTFPMSADSQESSLCHLN